MRAKSNRTSIVALTLAGAAAGFVLRCWQLGRFFSQGVRHIPASVWALGILSAVVVAALALLSSTLKKRSDYRSAFSSEASALAVSTAAAALVLAGSVMTLLTQPYGIQLILGFFGIAAALCFAATAVLRFRGTVPSAGLHMVPCIYLVVKLILDFKRWSVDPAVLDSCFALFAAIAAMCAVLTRQDFDALTKVRGSSSSSSQSFSGEKYICSAVWALTLRSVVSKKSISLQGI